MKIRDVQTFYADCPIRHCVNTDAHLRTKATIRVDISIFRRPMVNSLKRTAKPPVDQEVIGAWGRTRYLCLFQIGYKTSALSDVQDSRQYEQTQRTGDGACVIYHATNKYNQGVLHWR